MKTVANGGANVFQCCTHTAIIVGVRVHCRTEVALPQGEEPPVPMSRTLGGRQARSGRFREDKRTPIIPAQICFR
jgi:hypothetical protein